MLGAAAFATVAPLQMWVLEQAGGAGQGLASSLNIAAFNLGNAFGAWLGGVVISHGPGLAGIAPIAALVPLAALALACGRSPSTGARCARWPPEPVPPLDRRTTWIIGNSAPRA